MQMAQPNGIQNTDHHLTKQHNNRLEYIIKLKESSEGRNTLKAQYTMTSLEFLYAFQCFFKKVITQKKVTHYKYRR